MSRQLDIGTGPCPVWRLTLNRPAQHNALSLQLLEELHEALTLAERRDDVRILILAAAGKSFCSGADLGPALRDSTDPVLDREFLDALAQVLRQLHELDKPTVARIQGPVFGGGVGLALCCDFAIGSTAATVCFPEVRLGIVPKVVAPYVVAALGERRARSLLISATRLSAPDACHYGLLHACCAPEELDELIDAWIAQLAQGRTQAIAQTKQLLRALSPLQCDPSSGLQAAQKP